MPPITKNLLIINVLVFAASYVARQYGVDLNDLFGLHFFLASSFNPLQLVSYMFLHAGWEHIFFNMFAVWMFGRIMEQTFGPQRFLLYYMVCGIGAGLMQEMVQYVSYLSQGLDAYDHVNLNGILMETSDYLNRWTTVGASGVFRDGLCRDRVALRADAFHGWSGPLRPLGRYALWPAAHSALAWPPQGRTLLEGLVEQPV